MIKYTHIYSCLLCLIILLNGCKREEPKACPGSCNQMEFSLIDSEPTFSPDGLSIAYYHAGNIDKSGIYIIHIDGTNNRLWHKGPASNPSWSADGKWISFSEGAQIIKKKLNGDSLTYVTTEGRNFYPSWSPDGKWITFDSNLESPNGMKFIWKAKTDGIEKTRIAYDPTNGEIRMPFWGKDDKIVHIRYVNDGTHGPEIYSMNSDGSQAVRLTKDNNFDSDPKSSVTNKIVYTSQPYNGYPSIWIMDSDGNNKHQLINHVSYNATWSPDGTSIVYTDARKESGRLWLISINGNNKKQLTFSANF